MANEETLLGIDIGTSGCRAVLLTSNGEVLGEAETPHEPYRPRPGWAEMDPEVWYRAAVVAVRQLRIASSNAPAPAGIGISGQMISCTYLGEHGVIHPSILWMDQRTTPIVDRLVQDFGDMLPPITMTPINTAYTLPRILWLREQQPSLWGDLRRILWSKDYVRYRLTGVCATDPTDASGSLLLDSLERSWSDPILEAIDIDERLLPELFESHEVVGGLSDDGARDLGLPVGTPVVAGAGDLFSENLSAGNVHHNQRLIRFGSCGSVSSPVDRPLLDPQRRCPCYVHCLPGRWLAESSSQAFGLAEAWFKSAFYSVDASEEAALAIHGLAEEEVGSVPPGAEGLVFNPFIQGAPYWDPALTGGFHGIRPTHRRGHFMRAVLEGATYALADAVEMLDGMRSEEPRDAHRDLEWTAIGGGTRSEAWCGIAAAVLGAELRVLEGASPAKGAAMLAGIGTGVFQSFEDAIATCVSPARVVHPGEATTDAYRALHHDYRRIHELFSP
jgi:xylulokinase